MEVGKTITTTEITGSGGGREVMEGERGERESMGVGDGSRKAGQCVEERERGSNIRSSFMALSVV